MTALAAVAQEDGGYVERAEMARACAALFLAGIRVYYTDAAATLKGTTNGTDGGESLSDLTGDRRLLAALCEPLDACPQRVGDAMIEALDAGRRFNANAMDRPAPEIPEDYSGINAWRSKHKRREKAAPITLG